MDNNENQAVFFGGTREEYLVKAVSLVRGFFDRSGHALPKELRVSVGFPGGGSARKRIGEHWHPKSSRDGVSQIFISPVLDDSYQVLDVLCHELVHSVYPSDGHRKGFAKACKALGMSKPWKTASVPRESNLGGLLKLIEQYIGRYPHSALNLSDRKKQTTRMVKCLCESCGYVARTSNQWIESSGAPICPCNDTAMTVEVK